MTTTTPASHVAAAAETIAAQPWHLAGCLVSLRDAVDAHWPGRSKASDGGIGDERHQAEGSGSDHNPWLHNTVRAYDFTAAGIDAHWLAEQLRMLGQYGDLRLAGGGYVVWNGQITAPDFSHWQHYTGADPHTTHLHVSVTRNTPAYEYGGPWSFLASKPTPAQHHEPAPAPAHEPAPAHDATGHGESFRAELGDEGPEVEDLQRGLKRYAPAYAGDLAVDGEYGEKTAAAVAEYAHREALEPDTAPAARHELAGADGRNVGPRIAHELAHDGVIGY